MKMKNIIGILSLVLLTACSSDVAPTNGGVRKAIGLSVEEAVACEKNNVFGIDAFRAACAVSESNNNVLISPLSVSMFLGMRANYSSEDTKRQIVEALGYDNIDAFNSLNAKLLKELGGLDRRTTINLANSVWYDGRYEVKGDVYAALSKYYMADFFNCEPTASATKTKIAKWISDNSKNCLGYAPDDFTYLVMNVLYFNGTWTDKFEKKQTQCLTFKGRDKSTVVDMMHRSGYELVGASADFEVCCRDFGNGAYSCTFVLPLEGVDIDELSRELTAADLSSVQMKMYLTELYMPKFQLSDDFADFDSFLRQIGISHFGGSILEGYDGGAPMFEHKTYLKINEEGATAASMTAETDLLLPVDGVWNFRLDRPFLFFINERSTGACILAGKVVNL